MYRKLTAVLVSLFVLAIMLTAGLAQDPDSPRPDETITGIVEFEGATLYAGPDFAYEPVAQLQQNTSVTVLGRRGDFRYQWDGSQWLEIAFEGETAWVYARLLRTSIPFNSIPPTGRPLPRNRNGRVPPAFDLSDDVCDSWTGEFTRIGDFMQGDTVLTVTYPELPGANVYSVIVISPFGDRTAHDSTITSAEIRLEDIKQTGGTYVWRVAPYWTNEPNRRSWQQICLLQTGGTFERPGFVMTPRPTRTFRYTFFRTPVPTSVPPPLVP